MSILFQSDVPKLLVDIGYRRGKKADTRKSVRMSAACTELQRRYTSMYDNLGHYRVCRAWGAATTANRYNRSICAEPQPPTHLLPHKRRRGAIVIVGCGCIEGKAGKLLKYTRHHVVAGSLYISTSIQR